MNKYIIVLLFVFLVFPLNAEPLDDADSLFREAQSFYKKADYNEAITVFNKALSLYEKIQSDNGSIRGTIDIWLGASYYKLNDMDKSIKCYEEAIVILRKNNEKENLVNAINGISYTYLAQKNYEKIIEYYKLAASIFDELKEPDKKAVYLSYIGGYYYYLKNYGQSVEYYSQAVDLYKELKNDREVFNNLNNIGGVFFYSGDKARALEYYKKAYQSGKTFLEENEAIPFLNNMASIAQEVKNYDDAVKYFLLIADYKKKDGNKNDLFTLYSSIAANYSLADKKARALEYYTLAYETGKGVVDEKSLASTLDSMASLQCDLDDYKSSIDNYLVLAKIHEKNKSLKDLAGTYNNIGFCYGKSGDFKDAGDYYKKALDIAGNLKDEELLASINLNYGLMDYNMADYRDSIACLEKFLGSGKKPEGKNYIINAYITIGSAYYYLNAYNDFKKNFDEAEKVAAGYDDKNFLISVYENYAELYQKMPDYGKTLDYFNKALEVSDKLGSRDHSAIILNNIGAAYIDMEEYGKAMDYYNRALEINTALGRDEEIATQYGNIGQAYFLMNEFDKALGYMNKSLAYFEKSSDRKKFVSALNNTGEIFRLWGKYDTALEYYNRALKIAEELGAKDEEATLYNNFGMLYKSNGEYDSALDYFNRALVIEKKLGAKPDVSINLSNIGETYRLMKDYEKAAKYFTDALSIDRELGNRSKIANRLNGIALLYTDKGNYEKSNEYLFEAMKYTENSSKVDISTYYNNIGFNYCFLKEYGKAEDYLNKAVAIKEELRETASGSIRMDYLASQISTYQLLIYAYVLAGDAEKALETAELSRAKYLTERISRKLKNEITYPGIESLVKNIDRDTVVVSFSNINRDYYPVRIIIADGKIEYKPLDQNALSFSETDMNDIAEINEKSRGLKIIKSGNVEKDEGIKIKKFEDIYGRLSDLVYYYRNLLSNPAINFFEDKNANRISRSLYDYFFGDIEDLLKDKKNIIIIPDDVLGLLPFETLIDPNGKYLVEDHDVKYTQSLTVLNLIKDRKYDKARHELIAFGGAVYDDKSYKKDMTIDEASYDKMLKDSVASLNRGEKSAGIYGYLKGAVWQNLPGTLSEVKSIGDIYKSGKIFTGANVTEKNIKELSEKRELEKYKIIHFATHGLVVPDSPELSALVLSLSDKLNTNEDGYLQSGEIANLDLNADFVNLSACETGLGKIYGGEGIVGLTQSFIIAGANGISVSLWEVADVSTMIFMTDLYKLIRDKKMDYFDAESTIKRLFIKDKKFSNPYFWAPFVYYGQ